MSEIHFGALDLNLLRVLDAMAEEGNVTRAGARLGLTQSAVSHALRRLRRLLDDELFVRGPEGMQPTARAREIAPRVRQGLHQLQAALTPARFSPADTRRKFNIAAGPYVCTTLIPVLAALIRKSAPGAELRLHAIGPRIADDLQTGRADVAVGGFGAVGSRFDKETLFQETRVWVLRADHPEAQSATLSIDALARLSHVVVAAADEDRAVDGRVAEGGLERRVIWDDGGALDAALAGRDCSRTVGLVTQDALSTLAIASRTDMAAQAPRRLARAFADQYRLKLFDPPYPSRPAAIEALWRRDLVEPASIDWLRSCLREAAALLPA